MNTGSMPAQTHILWKIKIYANVWEFDFESSFKSCKRYSIMDAVFYVRMGGAKEHIDQVSLCNSLRMAFA